MNFLFFFIERILELSYKNLIIAFFSGYGKNFSFPNENVDDNKEDFEEAEIIENGETADGEVVMLLTVEVKEGEEQVLTLYKNQSPKMAAKVYFFINLSVSFFIIYY